MMAHREWAILLRKQELVTGPMGFIYIYVGIDQNGENFHSFFLPRDKL